MHTDPNFWPNPAGTSGGDGQNQWTAPLPTGKELENIKDDENDEDEIVISESSTDIFDYK